MSPAVTLPKISRQAIQRHFGRTIFERGRKLHDADAVLDVTWDPDDRLIFASVQGSAPVPYGVTIDTVGGRIDAECDCPYQFDCKHAAAALLAVIDGRSVSRDGMRERVAEQWLSRFIETRGDGGGGEVGAVTGSDASAATGQRERWIYSLQPGSDGPDLPGRAATGTSAATATATETETGETNVNRVEANLLRSKLKQDGQWSQGRRFHVVRDRYQAHGTGSSGGDAEIRALIEMRLQATLGRWHADSADPGSYPLDSRTGAVLLDLLVDTGRCYLGADRSTPIVAGPTLRPSLDWHDAADGSRRLSITLDGVDDWWLAQTDPPRYVDVADGRVGALETELRGRELALVREMPPIPRALAPGFANRLVASLPSPGLPPPAEPNLRTIDTDPVPSLLVLSIDESPHVDSWIVMTIARYAEDVAFPMVPGAAESHATLTGDDGEEIRVERRLGLERSALDTFREKFPDFVPTRLPGEDALVDFGYAPTANDPSGRFRAFRSLVAARDALVAEGWRLDVLPPVNTKAESVNGLEARFEPSEYGWFDLGLALKHEGRDYDLLPLVVDWLEGGSSDAPLFTQTPDGDWLEVPASLLAPVAETLRELGEGEGRNARIKLSRARALSIEKLSDELEEAGVDAEWHGEKQLFELGRRLRELGEIDTAALADTPVPAGLQAELRPYQRTGLGWLNLLAEHGLNGILADDMGLGKTLQTIAHIVSAREAGTLAGAALVVAPTSLLGNWARETARFAPGLSVRVWHGGDRHEAPIEDDESDLVITSYTLALRDRERLVARDFELLVLDEAQNVRNPQAKITQAVKALPIERRLCLTGTPLENHLGELWSLFDFLMPGLLGNRARFTRHFRTPIEKHGDAERQQRLASAVRPFLLRRKKEEVATELPPKTEIVREVELGPQQARLYESIRVAMEARVRKLMQSKGLAKSHIEMLDALLKLRQTCCHPALVKVPSAAKVKESAKTDLALDMIDELVDEGRRILLFSQFTGMLSLLEEGLRKRGRRWVKLTGATRKRDEAIDAFQNGDVPLFLISLKAGGTGLNLTAADTVIHYDPWWNPAVERQASDRAHRIGQEKPVFVYKLVTTGTVEERIVEMQARKQALSDATIERGEGEAIAKLSVGEVLSLFSQG